MKSRPSARAAPPSRSPWYSFQPVASTPATPSAIPSTIQRTAGGASGSSSGAPAQSPAASAAAKVASTPAAAGRAPRASYSSRLPPEKATTPSATPTRIGRTQPPRRRIISSRGKAAIPSPIVQQRRALAGVRRHHLAHEHGVVAAGAALGHAAVQPRQRLVQHRRAGVLRAEGHAGELAVQLVAGEAPGQRLALAVGQHVHGED